MKYNLGITKKLFIITTIIFAVFITSALILQSLFFEKFYISKKKRELNAHVEKFIPAYNKAADSAAADALILQYEEDYNLKLGIYSNSGPIRVLYNPSLGKRNLDRAEVFDMFIREWPRSSTNALTVNNLKKPITIPVKIRESLSLLNVSPNQTKNQIIFATSSLQPVSEAAKTNAEFFIYFYIGALFFIILLSFIYSNMIAKPLVKINNVATKMAKLDFTEKCETKGNDEISNMAASLNFLSENLNDALTSLRSANAKLEEDIEKERSLERMRKEFVTSVSHELKTPITLIDGYAEGLRDDIFEEDEREYYLDIIIDEARKMGSLVADMLDLSQLESGNFKLSKDTFAVADLIQFTVKKYTAVIEEKSITMEFSLVENTLINADWNRMEQVMTNFITNAIRHVNTDGTIYIRMTEVDSFIRVEVENTGSSIPEEDLSKIWDKFYKIDKSRTRKLGGTGVGLSIVKNILLLHGFNYGVENTEAGVKFYFIIPKEI
jgi:two-component system sensor histidine kinase VanS